LISPELFFLLLLYFFLPQRISSAIQHSIHFSCQKIFPIQVPPNRTHSKKPKRNKSHEKNETHKKRRKEEKNKTKCLYCHFLSFYWHEEK
jgi:hypothetical protein